MCAHRHLKSRRAYSESSRLTVDVAADADITQHLSGRCPDLLQCRDLSLFAGVPPDHIDIGR